MHSSLKFFQEQYLATSSSILSTGILRHPALRRFSSYLMLPKTVHVFLTTTRASRNIHSESLKVPGKTCSHDLGLHGNFAFPWACTHPSSTMAPKVTCGKGRRPKTESECSRGHIRSLRPHRGLHVRPSGMRTPKH